MLFSFQILVTFILSRKKKFENCVLHSKLLLFFFISDDNVKDFLFCKQIFSGLQMALLSQKLNRRRR